jgi:hypothetical protein
LRGGDQVYLVGWQGRGRLRFAGDGKRRVERP